ncbi:MAG TPA: hypothetical protein VFJ84_02495 [Candidatus Saccharimonadales bacterium]|nr:hypothetical protein [Candidatus Saccharimonadales bacterium]
MVRSFFVIKTPVSRLFYLGIALLLSASFLPAVLSGRALAAGQITNRSLTLNSAVPGKTGVTYTFSFRTATTADIKGLKFIACTTAIGSYPGGTCTAPAGINFNVGAFNNAATAGFTDTTNAFTFDSTGANDCVPSATNHNIICLNRATTSGNDTNTATNKTIQFTGITNPTTANTSFYVGIMTYSDNVYTAANIVDAGTTAAAIVSTLQVNARVAETLQFCVGSTTVDSDSTGTVATDCSTVTDAQVNLGTLDSSKINVTPVTTNCTTTDCGKNGVAMVRSNAINGTVVYYDAVQQAGTHHLGTLRVSGSTCDNSADNASTSNTDACFNVSTTKTALDSVTERFGMTVAGVNCGSTTSYTCTGTSDSNLVRDTNYNGDGTTTYASADIDQINGPTTEGFAWDESGTAVPIASSASSTIKQVDDEALILKFAAHPLITTPFGTYQSQADFIAVSTY